MLQTCLEFVVPLAEFPNLRPLESDAGWLPHGYPHEHEEKDVLPFNKIYPPALGLPPPPFGRYSAAAAMLQSN